MPVGLLVAFQAMLERSLVFRDRVCVTLDCGMVRERLSEPSDPATTF